MRIAVEAWRAEVERSGIGQYAYHLVRALAGLPEIEDHQLLALTRFSVDLGLFGLNGSVPGQGASPEPGSSPGLHRNGKAGGLRVRAVPGKPVLRELFRIRGALAEEKPSVCHFTASYLPFRAGCRTVVTIHDLAFLRYPETFTFKDRMLLRSLLPSAARRADRVIAVSESTKTDLVERWRVAEDRIRVVHHGVDAAFIQVSQEDGARAREKYGIDRPYLLFVGTIQPRKNLSRLFRAFALARERRGLDHILVAAGTEGWMVEETYRSAESRPGPEEIRFLGYVPDDDLPGLYAGADAFILPSLYEGFGLPLAEAMACGTPALASRCSSLPEVGGDAALYFDPMDVEEMAEAIGRCLSDARLREELSRRGRERAKVFTWRATAEKTLSCYLEAADA